MTTKVKKKASRKNAIPDLESALKELETLVKRMEEGESSLEESLKDFERGIELTRQCQQALKIAEQKVQQLTGDSEDARLIEFDND
ncbi:Exodeoxyribonuclease VII small subunit [hydrothermal vent metagenome]|uniref:Exodeoxyribonuclease VII small subunit n=1 Tax=hydrothermal vent metagenome TaxID=652676 RepID=A0A3B1CA40_9ZZZZ